ncbi:hypothetical protein BDV09DRAFT_201272 [Aspergillus tetrazonus]
MALDPIALTGNIVQFIDFATKIISEIRERYATGSTAENEELKLIATSLKNLSDGLIPRLNRGTATKTVAERNSIEDLAHACNGVANDLLSLMNDLTLQPGSNRKWRSFRRGVRAALEKSTVVTLEGRVKNLQSQLVLEIVTLISGQQDNILSAFEYMKISHTGSLEPLSSSARESDWNLQTHTSQKGANQTDCFIQTPGPPSLLSDALKLLKLSPTTAILCSLWYESMAIRHSRIPKAHAETFQWVLRSSELPPSDDRFGIKFLDWLRSGDGIYWITGKPGSGKSTLMKYICNHSKTMDALSIWAGSKTLVTAKFFFWNAGTPMQKSLQGLLQSLLYEVLQNLPSLISTVCAERWKAVIPIRPWDIDELSETLHGILRLTQHKACFSVFIDGLDEYEGDIHEFLRVLNGFMKYPSIKFCLASRPWNIFEDNYGRDQNRKLYLQDLTKEDISNYTSSNLKKHMATLRFCSADLDLNPLVKEILIKAQGVFLWVSLVVRSLCVGLSNGDDLATLQGRLRSLPSDLDAFFEHILYSIEDVYLQQTALLFQVALDTSMPQYLLVYSFLMDSDPELPLKIQFGSLTAADLFDQMYAAQRRLNARSQCLLEVYPHLDSPEHAAENGYDGFDCCATKVAFLHRTVRDFLLHKDLGSLLKVSPSYAKRSISRAILGFLKCGLPKYISKSPNLSELAQILLLARENEIESGSTDLAMLDELAQTTRKLLILGRLGNKPDILALSALCDITPSVSLAVYGGLEIHCTEKLESDPKLVLENGQKILERGFDIYISGSEHARKCYVHLVSELFRRGLDPRCASSRKIWGRIFEEDCHSRQHMLGDELVRIFLSSGADPNHEVKGSPVWTKLIMEKSRKEPSWISMLALLLEQGINPNLEFRTHYKGTLWENVVYTLSSKGYKTKDDADIMNLMLKYGADPWLIIRTGSEEAISISEAVNEWFPLERYPMLHCTLNLKLRNTSRGNNIWWQRLIVLLGIFGHVESTFIQWTKADS